MKKSIAALSTGLVALLGSSVVLAATVTVTPSTASPTIGTQFTLTVSGADFPDTVGATLQLTFDPTKVAVFEPALNSGIVLAPGSPFTGGIALPPACTPTYTSGSGPGATVCNLSVLAPTVGTLPTGNFDAFQIVFTALAVGSANIVLVDDQADFSWTDAGTFTAIPVTYTQATVTVVSGPPVPDISVTDSAVPVNDLAIAYGNITVSNTNTQTVTVTNAGTAALTIGAVASANPLAAPFSIVTDNCSSQVLAASSSCAITVRFSPTALVSSSDDFDIPSDDPDSPAVSVAVNGTGTPPLPNIAVTDSIPDVNDRELAFGDLTINTTTTGTVTVTNTGEANLTIDPITPPAAPFSITADICSTLTLGPLDSCTITVQFAPVAVQASASSFAISSDDPDEPSVTIDLSGAGLAVPAPVIVVTDSVVPANDLVVGFGNITQGGTSTQTVTVSNTGNAPLNVGQVASANPLAAPFTIGTDTCSNQAVAPAATCTFQVVFSPTALVVSNDALDIPSNDAGTPATVSVSGTGIAVTVPDITVTDSVAPFDDLQIPFGTVDLGAAAVDQTVTVTNDGSGDLVMGTVGAVNGLAPPFSLVVAGSTCSGATLAPTETCTIVVQFDPTAEGDSVDSFSIPSNDPDEASVTINVSGSADGVLVIDGGSSALDPWSLAFLGGLPLLRRRRKAAAMKLAMAAAAGVLAAPVVMADDTWDWDYDGVYLGAGAIGTSLKNGSQSNSAFESVFDELGVPASGSFEDFPLGGQIYAGWMFTNRFGMEIRWSDSGNAYSDIDLVGSDGSRTPQGRLSASIDGFTFYGVGNWPIAERVDLFGKLGYTRQDASFEGITYADGGEGGSPAQLFPDADDDVGPAAAIGARFRFARHWASTVEGEYLGVDFDNTIDKPWRVGLNIEYWFGGNEIAAPVAAAAAVVVAAPPPPPPPPAEPMDSDKDGVVDGSDQCADTPAGDRVGAAGCSCDVTRQLTFASNSSELSDADKLVLDEMAENLTRLKFVSGVIEGHTDSSGADTYNQGLSERRAQVAADYLASKGIATDRMQVVGRGETDPVGDNKTAEGRAENRRVVAKRTDCDQ